MFGKSRDLINRYDKCQRNSFNSCKHQLYGSLNFLIISELLFYAEELYFVPNTDIFGGKPRYSHDECQ